MNQRKLFQMDDDAARIVDPVAPTGPPGKSLLTVGGVLLAIAGLYLGRDIFIPFAIAILLSFALAPLVSLLRRLKFPKIAAILVAVALGFSVLGGVSLIVGTQLVQLANDLPTYRETITQKIRSLRSSASGPGIVENVTSTIEDLSEELSTAEQGGEDLRAAEGGARREPVPVTIETQASRPLDVIWSILGPLISPLATAGIVVVFVIFMLIERQDLRDRFIKLIGAGDLQKTTEAISVAASRVSRYLLMQLLVNVTYAVPIGVGLYFIGIPNAVLWGVLAAVLRFIPYLGPFLAALFPIALAIAVDPGWSMLVWVIALIITVELISNNVVEPWLYGASTGLSSFAIIIAAIFWTTLWGPVGLFLSTPLTVCLVVIGRYVPRLEFLGVLLGSDPVLAPEERFYQRLTAGNIEEAVEIAEAYADETSSRAFYDEVAIPALRLAENDRQRSATDLSYRRIVADGAVAVVREVAEHVRESGSVIGDDPGEDAAHVQTPSGVDRRVLCIGGRTELDRAASEMMAQVLGEQGIGVRVHPPIAVSQDAIGQLDLNGIEVACISYLNPQPQVFARYVCRRLKRRARNVRTIVCFLNPPPMEAPASDLPAQMGSDAVALTLASAEEQIAGWLAPLTPPSTAMSEPAIPENEQGRLDALRALGLTAIKGESFDLLAKKVAEAFEVPIALVSLIGQTSQFWPGAAGLPEELEAGRQASRSTSICGHVVAQDDVLVIHDVAKDERFANNPFLLEKGIRFYAGAPLRTSSGFVLGSLCVIDTKPRAFSSKDRKLLQIIADELMSKVESAAAGHGPLGADRDAPSGGQSEVGLGTPI